MPPSYVELRARSAFSFLRAASSPEALIEEAARLGHSCLGLIDRGGLYGAPRFYKAARQHGLRALVGAEIPLAHGQVLSVLVQDRPGYRNLCRLLTRGNLRAPKGAGQVSWDEVEEHAAGLLVLEGHRDSPSERALACDDFEAARREVDRLSGIFPGRVYLEQHRSFEPFREHLDQGLRALAEVTGLPRVAVGDVRYARKEDRDLYDVLVATREGRPLDQMGTLLPPNDCLELSSAKTMAERFADDPRALAHTLEVAQRCDFTLADLGYRFPEFPLAPGETLDGRLRALTLQGARLRYRSEARLQRALPQIEKELGVIQRLNLAGYFLVVWDLSDFCRRNQILSQGRGSAANSAVCYSLGITAVDPIGQGLLFERFLSEERGEWPDIDLDLPSGDQRERVIQYAYQRYGRHGAAMTAVVITYRPKSASREVGKALGFPLEVLNKLSKLISRGGFEDPARIPERLEAAGLDPEHPRVRHYLRLVRKILHLPRHLGQHSGGMVLAAGRLDEVVPLENAAMENRTVIQWDKDDCEDLGILKVDLLGLGMMSALEKAIPMVRTHYGDEVDLAQLPTDDPGVYDLLCRADTIGVFQVESRAQMSTLPRLQPRCLYDLVVEVALIRPGPIQGNMVHPYLDRRAGRKPIAYPHPCLEPVLAKTLGVALFQEQLIQMAMRAAGFSGGKAEALRRAFSSKRSVEAMALLEADLRKGMDETGISPEGQDEIVTSITSFAHYGFPESHAASFALLVYASAYLKHHYPAAFFAAILNTWPMGFYHPSTLVRDAEAHGVPTRPVNLAHSQWDCILEADRGIRLGFRYVKGLRKDRARALIEAREERPFRDLADLRRRARLDTREAKILARIGALEPLGETRRSALWQASKADTWTGPLLQDLAPPKDPGDFAPMGEIQATAVDLDATGITTGPHPLAFERARLKKFGARTVAEVREQPNGSLVRVGGLVICRQRPFTKTGVVFLSLEDESGILNVMVPAKLFERERVKITTCPTLVIQGVHQCQDGAHQVLARKILAFRSFVAKVHSHDWH